MVCVWFFFFKQKTAYEMRISDWSSDVCSSDLAQNAGLSSADGVETGLTEKFKAAGKPIGGFETAREQLMLFETLDAQTQRTLLMRAAEEAEGAVKDVGALTAAWGRGDVAALEKMTPEEIASDPAARKAILTPPHHRWQPRVKRRG